MLKDNYNNDISNLSYTNLDFRTIYPEILELANKLSYKWNPIESNESDPGVVLLKLCALVADKCNYNADKGVLECFPQTVSQTSNARMLFDELGYTMKWYKSATTKLSAKWKNIEDNARTFTVPQFSMVCDSDEKVVYTILDELHISTNGDVSEANIIQGVVQDYQINNDNIITINNLDSNNRLYFNNSNIAYNGIFITSSNAVDEVTGRWINGVNDWILVDNLASQLPGTKCYKYGITANNSFYIEFPSDVSKLIAGGILIKYIVSDGIDGSVTKGTLNKFYGDVNAYVITDAGQIDESTVTLLNDDIVSIANLSSATNSANPESIEQAYINYKKTVGTFDTLVTLRDYENAIYDSDYLCSNGIVTDRTNDIQDSWTIMSVANGVSMEFIQQAQDKSMIFGDVILSSGALESFDVATCYDKIKEDHQNEIFDHTYTINDNLNDYGIISTDENASANVTLHNSKDKMDAFDLKFYMTKYVGSPLDGNQYNDTFTLIDSLFDTGSGGEALDAIKNEFANKSCVQHNFKLLETEKLCLFKNKFPIKCKVIPQYKVNDFQASQIKSNIELNLFKHFNARQLQFGEEIDYNDLYDVILQSDSRIKNIILDDIEYTTYAVYYQNNKVKEIAISDNVPEPTNANEKSMYNSIRNEILAKSILSGKTPLLNIDRNKALSPIIQIRGDYTPTKIDTKVTITVGNDGYTLRDNETVYCLSKEYVDKTTFATGVIFEYYSTSNTAPTTINKNQSYKLQTNDVLITYVAEEDGNYKYYKYTSGEIIKPTFNLIGRVGAKIDGISGTSGIISDSDKIAKIKDLRAASDIKSVLDGYSNISIQGVAQESTAGRYSYYYVISNKLTDDKKYSIELTSNSELATYTLGYDEYLICTTYNKDAVAVFGEGAILSVPSSTSITLISDYIDYSDFDENGMKALTDVWKKLNYNITITQQQIVVLSTGVHINSVSNGTATIANTPISATTVSYTDTDGENQELPMVDGGWNIYSRLSINSSSDNPQKLLSGQSITVYLSDDYSVDPIEISSTNLSPITILFDPMFSHRGGEGIEINSLNSSYGGDPITLLVYILAPSASHGQMESDDDFQTVKFKLGNTTSYSKQWSVQLSTDCKYVLPINIATNNSIYVTYDGVTVTDFYGVSSFESGQYYLILSTDDGSSSHSMQMALEGANDASATIQVLSMYKYTNELNDALLNKMGEYDPNHKFDFTFTPNDSVKIMNPLNASSFFDVNHICNKFTIAQIDTKSFKDKNNFIVEQRIRG